MALDGLSNSTEINFNNLNSAIFSSLSTQETSLKATMNTISVDSDGNVSQSDLLKMQQQLQQWSIMIDLQSTMTKQIGDSLKAVIQKAS